MPNCGRSRRSGVTAPATRRSTRKTPNSSKTRCANCSPRSLTEPDDGVRDVELFEGGDLLGAELHSDRSKCIVEVLLPGRADNRCADHGLGEQPGEGNLGPADTARGGDLPDALDNS